MKFYLGGAQPHCRTDHATRYLCDVDATHVFLFKKHKLIKTILIVFGIKMIWFAGTYYFANQFMRIAEYIVE
jgi:hypothetical protein